VKISHFNDLLRAAREQADAQRLLFVFTRAGVPDDATPQQRARFARRQGGTLTPLMCVDKTPDEVASFAALLTEAQRLGKPWDIVFVTALAGTGPIGPLPAQAQEPMQRMVDAIQSGAVGRFLAFDADGQPVVFS
jgi:hypothetical protein